MTYPFYTPQAIESDWTENRVFVGWGGGLRVLDVSQNVPGTSKPDPKLLTGGNHQGAMRTKSGFVFDVAKTDDFVFLAAGLAGPARANRSPSYQLQWVASTFKDARAVAPVIVGEDTWVFVATATGALWVAKGSSEAAPVPGPSGSAFGPFTISSNLRIDTLAVTRLTDPNYVTLLVGTACQGVLRYDFPVASFPPASLPAATAQWNPQNAAGYSKFVRDLVLDESASPPRAYAACFGHGLFALDINPPTHATPLAEVTNGFPITVPGHPSGTYYRAVALDPDADRLVLGMGPPLPEEVHFWGSCIFPYPCDLSAPNSRLAASPHALFVYDVGQSSPVLEASLAKDEMDSTALPQYVLDLAVSPEIGGEYYVDVATDAVGYTLVKGFVDGGAWRLERIGSFDDRDDAPIGAPDDVVIVGNGIYASTEHLLVSHDRSVPIAASTPHGPLQAPSGLAEANVITLTSVGQPHPRILGTDHNDRAHFFDISTGHEVDPVHLGSIPLFGRPNAFYAIEGYSAHDAWFLFTPNMGDADAFTMGAGVVRVFDVTAKEPRDAFSLGIWKDAQAAPAGDGKLRFLFDLSAKKIDGSAHAVWVDYGPNMTTAGDDSCGILVLEATYAESPTPRVTFEFHGTVPAKQNLVNPDPVGRVHHDELNQRLYVALGCNGIGVYDVSSPLAPTLIAQRDLGTSVLHVREIPGHEHLAVISSIEYGKGLGVLDVTNASTIQSASVTWFPLAFQALKAEPDPDVEGRFWVADGHGGLHAVTFQF